MKDSSLIYNDRMKQYIIRCCNNRKRYNEFLRDIVNKDGKIIDKVMKLVRKK